MTPERRARWLLLTNMLLLTLLAALCLHEGYLQRAWRRGTAPPAKPYIHTDNPHFAEALDFDTLYHSHPSVVMLGNSMTGKMQWSELLGRCDVSTRAVPGDLTSGILARVADVIALHPAMTFVEGGINDIDYRKPLSDIVANIRQTAARLRAAGIRPVLTAVTQVTSAYPRSDSVNGAVRIVNTQLAAVALAEGYDFINLNPRIAPSGVLNLQYARADGCHLTARAYRLWADEVLRILRVRRI